MHIWHIVYRKGEAVVTILEKKYLPSKHNYADKYSGVKKLCLI
jgi:hypothetical protein